MQSGDTPSMQIVREVATVDGVDPAELTPPLYEVIDPDALDAMVQTVGSDVTVEFTYRGHAIRVDGSGRVAVGSHDRDRSRPE